MDVQSAARRWADTWQRAWPAKQAEQIAGLYNEAASYRSSPFRQPEVGGALAYVERQFAVEEAVECRLLSPSPRVIALRSSGGQVSSRRARR